MPEIPAPDDVFLQMLGWLGASGVVVAAVALLLVLAAWIGFLRSGARMVAALVRWAGQWLPGRAAAIGIHLLFLIPFVVLWSAATSLVKRLQDDRRPQGVGWYVAQAPERLWSVLGWAGFDADQFASLVAPVVLVAGLHLIRAARVSFLLRLPVWLGAVFSYVVIFAFIVLGCVVSFVFSLGYAVAGSVETELTPGADPNHYAAAVGGWAATGAGFAVLLFVAAGATKSVHAIYYDDWW